MICFFQVETLILFVNLGETRSHVLSWFPLEFPTTFPKPTKKPKASRETKRARTKRARAGDDGRRGATGAGGDDGRSGDGSVAKDIIAGSFVLSAFTQ